MVLLTPQWAISSWFLVLMSTRKCQFLAEKKKSFGSIWVTCLLLWFWAGSSDWRMTTTQGEGGSGAPEEGVSSGQWANRLWEVKPLPLSCSAHDSPVPIHWLWFWVLPGLEGMGSGRRAEPENSSIWGQALLVSNLAVSESWPSSGGPRGPLESPQPRVLQREPLKCGPCSPPSDWSALGLGSLLQAPRNIKRSPWRQPGTGPHDSHVDHRKKTCLQSSSPLPLFPACPSRSSKSSQAQCVKFSTCRAYVSSPESWPIGDVLSLPLLLCPSFPVKEEALSMVLITRRV